jgi:dihydroflavonol-4-reductase
VTSRQSLVIGASGYLGSHVTRQLVANGGDVRVMVRDGANTVGIDDLEVTRRSSSTHRRHRPSP